MNQSVEEIIGSITIENPFDQVLAQSRSWEQQIPILKAALKDHAGRIYFEFSIPRLGKRVDCLVII